MNLVSAFFYMPSHVNEMKAHQERKPSEGWFHHYEHSEGSVDKNSVTWITWLQFMHCWVLNAFIFRNIVSFTAEYFESLVFCASDFKLGTNFF
jgi:hypothetical protein